MVRIITDTTSSIPSRIAQELSIPYFPQIIIFGEDSFRDDNEIDTETFLKKFRSFQGVPKTAAPAPALYNPVFKEILDQGDSIIVICPSAELSGTVRSAETAAAEFPGGDIRVIDSRSIGSGLGSIVFEAVRMAKEGADADTIAKKALELSQKNRVYFVVDTLEYLHRGGRIGGAQALFGSLLQIKPILSLKDGRTVPVETQRTKKNAQSRLREIIEKDCPHNPSSHLTLMQGDAMEDAIRFRDEIQNTKGFTDIPIYELPPAVLVHTGPGVLAASFFVD